MRNISAINPGHSLRARLSLTYGGTAVLLITSLITILEFIDQANLSRLADNPQQVVQYLQWQLLLLGIIFTLLFLIVGWFIAGRIAKPLVLITQAANQIHIDDKMHVIPTFAGHDEIASLSHSLNYLVADLATQRNALQTAKAELEARVQERTRKLAALYDILEAAVELDDLAAIAQRSLQRLVAITRSTAGVVHLLDGSGKTLHLAAQLGWENAGLEKLRTVPETAVLYQSVMQHGLVLIANPTADTRTASWPIAASDGTYLGVAIQANEQAWGMVSLIGPDVAHISGEESDLVQTAARQIATTVERFHLRQQAAQLAVVEERNRLARELHDSVTQALYSATLFAEAGQRMATSGNLDKALTYLDEVLDTSRQALKEMRLLVYKLRPSTLEKEGLVAALAYRLKAVEGRAGIEQQLTVNGDLALTPDVEAAIYHIAVEALNNALKHAHATAVSVYLAPEPHGTITLVVTDNGQGFEMATAVNAGGLGLTSMSERAAELGGTLTIETSAGQGTKITVRLPLAG
ncbi:MAG: GAF domain-containing protein [Anaerolineales bacterium]|nr:GAF domain-containing protein [Anaerolineales bacterium]